jgi:hypothetical protein
MGRTATYEMALHLADLYLHGVEGFAEQFPLLHGRDGRWGGRHGRGCRGGRRGA